MKYNKILIAVDNSPHSFEAAKAGFQLAKKLDAELALVFVTEIIIDISDVAEPVIPVNLVKVQKEEAATTLEQLTSKYGSDAKVQHFLPEGSPREEILAAADKWNTDIIVMGTHGRTGLGHLILGSVAEYVVRHSKVPVMVVPLKK